MNLRIFVARLVFALALLVAAAGTGHANSVSCSSAGDLNTALNGLVSGTLTVSGTCTSNGSPFSVTNNGVTVDCTAGGGILKDQLFINADGVTVKGCIINGSSALSGANTGVVINGTATATLVSNNINTWGADGVDVNRGGRLNIIGGNVNTGNTTGVAINVFGGAAASIGYDTNGNFASSPVQITSNGTGVNIAGLARVSLVSPDIFSNHLAGVSIQRNATLEVVNGLIENNLGDGIDIQDGATVVFDSNDLGGSGTATNISGNSGVGILMFGGTLDMDTANITGNHSDGIQMSLGAIANVDGGTISANFGGGINASSGSAVKLRNLTITGNSGGPPVSAILSTFDIKSTTLTAPGTLGLPALLAYRSSVELVTTTVNGPTNSDAVGALGGASMLLAHATLNSADANDAALQIADGSVVVSAGGNTIANTTPNATAINVTNASTFHQQTSAILGAFFPPAADTITGGGVVQMQSNMELGTGVSVPSTWTGGITVAQNSSFRMDGGMSISGIVTLSQGSNGFFNISAGGTNTVTGTVKCNGSTSHVVGTNSVSPT